MNMNFSQLERISVRKKAPRSGTFYSTIAHSESGETGADVADAEPLLPDDDDDDCYDESVEDCDIKETFEMVEKALRCSDLV